MSVTVIPKFFDESQSSLLQYERKQILPLVPPCFSKLVIAQEIPQQEETVEKETDKQCTARKLEYLEKVVELFPMTSGQPIIQFTQASETETIHQPLRIGVVLSGGQAPGGHTVIAGIYDYIKKCNQNSQLFGFLMGPAGVYDHQYIEITDELMDCYRNIGGFHMIRSGRHKIETNLQKRQCLLITKKLELHGLVIIGGDDSNTNAAVLAEYFKSQNATTCIAGVPKTIDGDLRNEYVETSFGFDTAVRTYAEFIGNLGMDVSTSRKYYHFVRLMGRAASNITLRCALLTRPNLTIIGEEVKEKNLKLVDIIQEVYNLVVTRQDMGKNYGIVLVPEGLIEFIPEVEQLISEINTILSEGEFDESKLQPASAAVYASLPSNIRNQLLLDRDPHGNVQLSKIATEQLLILMVKEKLAATTSKERLENFIPRSHFFGYEGRAGTPSVFDNNYCYTLGHTAAALIDHKKTGYISTVANLRKPITEWIPGGCPLTRMMSIEVRKNKPVPVIKKYLVDLASPAFTLFSQAREIWKYRDIYASPGPLQFNDNPMELPLYSLVDPASDELLPEFPFGFESSKRRAWFPKFLSQLSPLQRQRLVAKVETPSILFEQNVRLKARKKFEIDDAQTEASVACSFPLQCRHNKHMLYNPAKAYDSEKAPMRLRGLRVGLVLTGQQASGVANVLVGLWERLSMEVPCGKVVGFIGGVAGILSNPPQYIEVTREDLSLSKNQGGFELLGRQHESEMLIATNEGLETTRRVCVDLRLDGLVLIGGRYTLTNVAVVSEYFLQRKVMTRVVGVPATQNNNIDSCIVESSLGFDSSSKCYNHLIGNLNTDAASCAKYWLFIRLMGSSKSQLVVEAALSTHPNVVLVSETYAAGDKTLDDVVSDIANVVISRASRELNFGTIVIPEGLISSLPQFRLLMSELNELTSNITDTNLITDLVKKLIHIDKYANEEVGLSPWNCMFLKSLPEFFRRHLVQPRTLGSIELTKIPTEELLAEMVAAELERRQQKGQCPKIYFAPLCFYFGYQGRSSLPSNFDCSLGLSHGSLAAMAVKGELTGYVTVIRRLAAPVAKWLPVLYPVTAFLKLQALSDYDRYPQKLLTVVPADMVRLNDRVYKTLIKNQQQWESEDRYTNPGPIQFKGLTAFQPNQTLIVENQNYLNMLEKVNHSLDYIRQAIGISGTDEKTLHAAVSTLTAIKQNMLNKDTV